MLGAMAEQMHSAEREKFKDGGLNHRGSDAMNPAYRAAEYESGGAGDDCCAGCRRKEIDSASGTFTSLAGLEYENALLCIRQWWKYNKIFFFPS